MEIFELSAFLLLALVAEVLGTIGGFGSSLFFVPIAAYFLDYHSALGVTAVFHVTSNLAKIALFKKGFDKHLLIYLGIPAVLFVILGAFLSKYLPTSQLELLLGVFLLLISVFLLLTENSHLQATKLNAALGGVSSGLIAGLLGTGGAIRGVVMAAFEIPKDVFVATSAIIDLAVDSSRTVVYGLNGFIHTHDLYLIPLLAIVSVAGTYMGKKVLGYISEKNFRKIVLGLVFTTGISMLMKAAWKVMAL